MGRAKYDEDGAKLCSDPRGIGCTNPARTMMGRLMSWCRECDRRRIKRKVYTCEAGHNYENRGYGCPVCRESTPVLRFLRDHVLAACDYICQYCGDPASHVDHIRPRSKGGEDEEDNLTASCGPCNGSKHDRFLNEWDMDRVEHALAHPIHGWKIAKEMERLSVQ